MEKKTNKGLICLVVILIITVLGFTGYILVDKGVIKLKKDENEKISTKEEIVEKDFDIDEAQKLLEKFGLGNAGTYCTNYPESVRVRAALSSIDKDKLEKKKCTDWYSVDESSYCRLEKGVLGANDDMTLIPYDLANKQYNKMFGENIKQKSFSDFSLYFGWSGYSYNAEHKVFIPVECGGCGGTRGPQTEVYKIKDAKVKGDKVTIRVYAQITIAGGYQYGSEVKFFIGNRLLEATTEEEATKEVLDKYLDEVDLYEVVFNNADGDYMLNSLVQVLK